MFIPTSDITQAELISAIIRNPLTVTPNTTVMEVIAQMSGGRTVCAVSQTTHSQEADLVIDARSSCVLVVENNELIGIFTERDVIKISVQKRNLENLAIGDVMSHPVVTLRESDFTDLFFAVNLLKQYRIRHLAVVDEQNQLRGILTHESLRKQTRPVDLLRLRLVNEVMTTKVICAAADVSILDIARLMAENCISSVMIVETQKSLTIPLGILTERDIVQFQALNLNFETCQAQTVMSTPIFCVNVHESLWNVQQIMEQRLIQRLAVTGTQGELIGIVTQSSILQALSPLELYKLTTVLEQKVLQLESEKIELLENRTVELEQQVVVRTTALRKKVEQERLIATVSAQIRSSLSLQNILDTTVTEIRGLLKCDRVIIYQFYPDFSGIVIAESIIAGGLSVLHTHPNDPCITPEYIEPYRQGQIRVVNDIYLESITLCHQETLIGFDIRAKLMIPIVVEDKLWGLML
ncbi:CBS domain-containing protein, partial [Dolichospermum sp. ST_sed9]|nr:CBS domain-containing protein [Dolichospermum sp. ST_sed9]